MTEVTVLVVRKKARAERGLTDAITESIEHVWQRHARRTPRHSACRWVDHDELATHVHVVPDTWLRAFAFGLIRETIRPLWRLNDGAFEPTEVGLAILEAANRCFCERYAHSSLGVWHALARGSGRPTELSSDETELAADALRLGTNEIAFLARA